LRASRDVDIAISETELANMRDADGDEKLAQAQK
jgi:hypothetical protein